MNKLLKVSLISLLIIFSSFAAYKISYFVAERYFFDKIFFKKSTAHGYIDCNGGCKLEKFGERAADINKIFGKNLKDLSTSVLGKSTEHDYTIAVIGDSITWGVGVRKDEMASALLQKKLLNIRKVKVLQLGFPGDDFLDNYLKSRLIQQSGPIDLYIFIIVENDLLFNRFGNYDEELKQQLISQCTNPNDLITYNYNKETPGYNYIDLVNKSFNNPQNLCVFKKTASLYPKNSIFLVSTWWPDTNMDLYTEGLKKEGFKVIFTEQAKSSPEYKKYWQQSNKYFRVSKTEAHPSRIVHEMYADILFEEITANPKWGF